MPKSGQAERVSLMAEKTCTSCGQAKEAGSKWFTCPECGCNLCYRCGIQNQSEKSNLEDLREGGSDARLRVTCPDCRYGMHSL
jgi:predicted RNA-binding Zn-ribbon protein involved in translation (DUF1610 family)